VLGVAIAFSETRSASFLYVQLIRVKTRPKSRLISRPSVHLAAQGGQVTGPCLEQVVTSSRIKGPLDGQSPGHHHRPPIARPYQKCHRVALAICSMWNWSAWTFESRWS